MRICILNEFFYPDDGGGTGTVISELARQLFDRNTGLEIDVVTSQHLYREHTELQNQFEDWDGIKITRLKTPRPNGKSLPVRTLINAVFSAAALWHLLWRKYDLLLVTTAPPVAPLAAVILKKLKKLPYVYTVYDLEPDRAKIMKVVSASNPFSRVLYHFQKMWLHEASKVVVLGRCMKEHICSAYSLPTENVVVIPVGADPSAIQPRGKMTEFRTQSGLSDFLVLYSGNFGRYHDFNTILDAAKQLSLKNDRIKFVLVGAGAQKEHIVERVQNEKISNVHIFPFVSQEAYPDLLASADVSLVTLEPGMEGICVPSKFYSILASGRPTVAMVGMKSEVARVIVEWNCGLQVDQGDTEKLVQTLSNLERQQGRVTEMGANARKALVNHYTSSLVAEQYFRVLVDCANLSGTCSHSLDAGPLTRSAIEPESLDTDRTMSDKNEKIESELVS